jgi:ISXO2-like transposase domain
MASAVFNGFADAGMKHTAKITGGGRPEGSDFKWVNTGVSNVKGAITGTLRSCDPQHAPRYLAAFEWRYNRRFDLPKNLERLARVATTIAPQPRKSIAEIRPNTADTSG